MKAQTESDVDAKDFGEMTYFRVISAEISGLHERREARVLQLDKPRDLALSPVKYHDKHSARAA